MKFETRRERELRRKRQKRSAILGMVFAILVVIGLGILLWNGKKNIEAKNVEYEKEISLLYHTPLQIPFPTRVSCKAYCPPTQSLLS